MNAAPEIPLDIRALLHDCILSLFWPKQKIIEFFESVGYRDDTLKSAIVGEFSLSRHAIVTEAFSRMSARADRGYPVFQTMIDRLSNWSHFDKYWFETTQKLDRAKAEESIAVLKNAVSKRNAATENRRTSAASAQRVRSSEADLSALTTAFQKMFGTGMTVQARGRLFERFLQELFNRQSIKMGDPFNINGEQIDGTFKFDGENYIVEAKWQDASTSTGDLYKFAHKVDGKMHGRGMFISVNGFSNEGIRAIVVGKQIQTILMDGEDLNAVLEGRISLEKLLDYKVRAAQTRGEVYVCAIRQQQKIN
jgi:Restriction endonuclease